MSSYMSVCQVYAFTYVLLLMYAFELQNLVYVLAHQPKFKFKIDGGRR